MSYTEKIDVLDMIIQILNEHEQKLDSLIERLEKIAEQAEPVSTPTKPEEDLAVDLDAAESSGYLEEHR